MNKSVVLLAAAAAILLSASPRTHADNVPWGYASATTTLANNNNPASTSTITMAGSSGVANGNSGIIIYTATTSSTATTVPDSFSSVPFNLSVTLTDVNATGSTSTAAVKSGVVTFAGLYSASNVTTQSLLPGVTTWTSPTTTSIVLGGADVGWRLYTVTLDSFTSPGQPTGAPGSIQAIVIITPTDGPSGSGEVSAAPEPASLVLAGFSLPVAALYLRRRIS